MNPVVRLAHAAAARATLTSAAEWQRLAREAIAEHDRVCLELSKVRKALASMGPRHQGLVELA